MEVVRHQVLLRAGGLPVIGLSRRASRGTWTPAVSASSGTITTSSATGRFFKQGNGLQIHVEITITTNGTGADAVVFTLPAVASVGAVLNGRATSVSGKQLQGLVAAAGNLVGVVNYDGTYPGASGELLLLDGWIET